MSKPNELLISAEVYFKYGNTTDWSGFSIPVPDDLLVLTSDNQGIRQGTGLAAFSGLTIEATIAAVRAGEAKATTILTELQPANNGELIAIENQLYEPTSTTPSSLALTLTGIASDDVVQNSNLVAIASQFGLINLNPNQTNMNDLVVINNHQMGPGVAISSLSYSIPVNPLSITGVEAYTNIGCTLPSEILYPNSTYYIKIFASDDNADNSLLSYTLTTSSSTTTIAPLGHGLFEVTLGNSDIPVSFTAGVAYGINTASVSVMMPLGSAPSLEISTIGIYSDLGCTQSVTSFNNNTTYYAQINAYGGGGSISIDSYTLTSDNSNISITNLSNGIFSITVGVVPTTGTTEITATAVYGMNRTSINTWVELNSWPAISITSFGVFSDLGCTVPVTSFGNNTTYYAKLIASGGAGSGNVLNVTSNNSYVTVNTIGNGVFSLVVGADPNVDSVTLTGLAVCSNSNSNTTLSVSLSSWPAITISSFNVFSDSGCTTPATSFNNNTTYYAKVVATGGAGAGNSFGVTSNNSNITVAAVGGGVFSLAVGVITTAGNVTFTATVTCSDHNNTATTTITLNSWPAISISSVGIFSDLACTIPATFFNSNTTYYVQINATGGAGGANNYGIMSNNGNVIAILISGNTFSISVGTISIAGSVTLTSTVSCSDGNATYVSIVPLNTPLMITSVTTYSDSGCTVPCSSFYNGVTYYAKIVPTGGGGSQTTDTYTLTSNNSSVISTAIGSGVFSLAVITPVAGTLTVTATVAYDGNLTQTTQTATLLGVPVVSITSITTYSDIGCTVPCSSFYNGVTYYAQIIPTGGGGSQSNDVYTLSSNNANVTVAAVGNGIFSLTVGSPTSTPVTFTGTASYNGSSASATQTATLMEVPPVTITSIATYSDSGCTVLCSSFNNNVTYYCKIVPTGGGGSQTTDTYTLSGNNAGVTVSPLGNGVFSIAVGTIASSTILELIGTATYGASTCSSANSATLTATSSVTPMFECVYGGTVYEQFSAVAIDSTGNIYCVGYTNSEGTYSAGLIAKFSPSLTLLASKYYSGSYYIQFSGVAVDQSGNIVAVGWYFVGSNNQRCLIVKYDSNLNILAQSGYGTVATNPANWFYGVTINAAGNYVCVGETYSSCTVALIVIFDTNLNILVQKTYVVVAAANEGDIFWAVTADSSGNIYTAGASKGAGSYATSGSVVKFDSNLNILAQKLFNGSSASEFYGIAVDSAGNIIAVGDPIIIDINSLIVKFDTNLNVLYSAYSTNTRSGSYEETLYGVTTDSSNNIIAVGYTNVEETSGSYSFLLKFNPTLGIISKKVYGTVGGSGNANEFKGVVIDASGNVSCVGWATNTTTKASVVKFPPTIPTGTFVGSVLTGLELQDSAYTQNSTTYSSQAVSGTLSTVSFTLSTLSFASATPSFTLTVDTL